MCAGIKKLTISACVLCAVCSDDGAENRSMSSSDEEDSDHDDDYMIREAEIPAAGEKHSKCI